MPIVNAKEFTLELGKAAKDLPEKHFLLFQKKLAFELLRRVVQKTPVDRKSVV